MSDNHEMVAAVITSALLRNSGIKETRLAVEKYLLCLDLVQSLSAEHAAHAAHAAPPPAPAEEATATS